MWDWTPPLPMPIRTWILPLSCTIWNIWAAPTGKRAILFQLASHSLLRRCPASVRKDLVPAARRNFASIVWINEAKALPHSIRQIRQEGPPASVPTLFLLSNGKGTPLPKEEWRMCARNYLSAFSTSSFHLFELPHDLYRQRPKEIADTVHRFLLDHL